MIAVLALLAASLRFDAQAASPASTVLATWRESLELDRPREVLSDKARVAPGGELEHDGEALSIVARAAWAIGDEKFASELVGAAHETEANRAWLVVERARELLEHDELDAAAKLVAGAKPNEVRFPELADCWLVRARALSRSGKLGEAAPLFQHFLELAPLAPEAPAACHQIAEAFAARGEAAKASPWFERASKLGTWQGYYRVRRLQIREHPDEPLPRLGLAELLLEANEIARAKAVLEELTRLAPNFANGWFHLGEALRRSNDFEGASKAYSRAVECDPEHSFARFNRALIARLAHRDSEARADFEHIVAGASAKDARLLNAHLELARLLARAGEQDAADARYRTYVELGGREPLEQAAKH